MKEYSLHRINMVFLSFCCSIFIGVMFLSVANIADAQTICGGPFYSVATPLNELGTNPYRRIISTNPLQYADTGLMGGLYPNGSNLPPAAHASAATSMAQSIQPLDINGNPAGNGKIVMVSIGMSNTSMEFGPFTQLANADPQKNPSLTFINGAMSSATADIWGNPNHTAYPVVWSTFMSKFSASTTPAQVQVAWVKLTQAGGDQGLAFPGKAEELQGYLRSVVRDIKSRFPNLKIVYFSSRVRGYTYINGLSPEPNAYETAFSVRWLIEDQINGDSDLRYSGVNPPAPLLLWGPYLWINGTTPRLDGRTWPQSNLTQDCTHPSDDGTQEVAEMMVDFFKTNTYTRWFLSTDTTVSPSPIVSPTSPASHCLPLGNVNCDSNVNVSDFLAVIRDYITGSFPQVNDINNDGKINGIDLVYVVTHFNQTITPTPTAPSPLTVQFTPDEGTFTTSFNLDLYVPQAQDYQIYYTTNGTDPDNIGNGILFNGNLIITQTTTVKARAYAAGYPTSLIYTKLYTVNVANQAPVANSQILNTSVNSALPVTLSFADSDGPGPYTYSILTNPQHGTLTGTGGARTYTPATNYSGTDSFTWRINDGQVNSNTATVTINISSATSSALIFDHTKVVSTANMNRIPIQYLDIARNRRVFFRHASIGFNIWDGLECMMSASPASFCRRNAPDGTFISDPSRYYIPNFAKFSITSQWVEECHSLNTENCNPIAHNKSGYFLTRLNGGMAPTTEYPQIVDTSLMNIVMFKFGNVNDMESAPMDWYFTPGHTYTDIYDLMAYEAAHPNQTMVYWSMPLGRLVSTTSRTFNENIRSVAQAEDLILFDLAAITSHLPNGTECLNSSGIPQLCDEYTDEVNGGHLNGYGKARVVQALWAFMARLAGWNGVLQ